jgi:hypothetical protein
MSSDIEYQHNILVQQQFQLRQLQMQQMQQQRLLQQQRRRLLPQARNGSMLSMNSERGHTVQRYNRLRSRVVREKSSDQFMGSFSEPRIPGRRTGLIGANDYSRRIPESFARVAPNVAVMQPQNADASLLLGNLRQAQPFLSSANLDLKNGAAVGTTFHNADPLGASSQSKRKLEAPSSSIIPDKSNSSSKDNLLDMQPADINSDINEFTLEEYRQHLEEYISNSSSHNHNVEGSPLVVDKHAVTNVAVDEKNNGNHSDLEDDWEKEKEKSNRSSKSKRGEKRRTINRNISGISGVSAYTKGSNMAMSLVSGMSELSDMMSATTDNLERTNSSNLSLMSELTDLSQHVDNLSLCDETM